MGKEELHQSIRITFIPCAGIIGLVLGVALSLTGCGLFLPISEAFDSGSSDSLAEQESPSLTSHRVIILDWSGGRTRIYSDRFLLGADLSRFSVSEGGALSDREFEFRESVRSRVEDMLSDIPELTFTVRDGQEIPLDQPATIVYLTQESRPDGRSDIGEGEYDPCDEEDENHAIVFGRSILDRGDGYAFEEWVNVFANVSAHEIAHTLGYGHVSREEINPDSRMMFVELMLDAHTMREMRQPQRFVIPQSSCPTEDAHENTSAGTPHLHNDAVESILEHEPF